MKLYLQRIITLVGVVLLNSLFVEVAGLRFFAVEIWTSLNAVGMVLRRFGPIGYGCYSKRQDISQRFFLFIFKWKGTIAKLLIRGNIA